MLPIALLSSGDPVSVDTETARGFDSDLASIKSSALYLLAIAMAAIIGHRALTQLRASSRSSFALPAQRSPLRRSRQVSANSHSNAQQHGALGPSLHRANSSAACASVCTLHSSCGPTPPFQKPPRPADRVTSRVPCCLSQGPAPGEAQARRRQRHWCVFDMHIKVCFAASATPCRLGHRPPGTQH